MSFYISLKQAKLSQKHQDKNSKISIVITSHNNRLFSTFIPGVQNPHWEDAFVAQSAENQIQFMLIKQKVHGKSAKKLSSNIVSLSKYLFLTKDQKEQIPLFEKQNHQTDTLIIEVCYRQNKNFIGPIQFYKKGNDDFQDDDEAQDIQIEGQNTKFSFWKWWGKDKSTQQQTAPFEGINKDNVKFYKGPHKNRNIFSLCDEVYDDQKFTVVQNYYNDQ